MTKRNNMAVCMTTNVMLPDFCTEIAEIIRSNLSPKKLQERILSYHEKDIAMALVSLTEEERRSEIHLLRSFDEDEIGSEMSTNFIVFPDNLTIIYYLRS